VTPSGLKDSVAIKGSLPSVAVQLSGELPTLRSLSPSDIAAMVDLQDKEAGSYHITIQVTPPDGTVVQSVTPADIDVTLVGR
jgi:YbbR domain-containing protein